MLFGKGWMVGNRLPSMVKKKTKTNISGSERWFIGHATFKESDQNVIEVPKER